ncbi:hypothetical protein [Azotobacter armeniacus]
MNEKVIMASPALRRDDDAVRFFVRLAGLLVLAAAGLLPDRQAEAAISCAHTLQEVGSIGDIAANSGPNGSFLLAPGASRSYTGMPIPGWARVVERSGHGQFSDDDGHDDDKGSDMDRVVGSLARASRSEANRNNVGGALKSPGFPLWVAGLEDSVGQRPPTPPLDMLDRLKAKELLDSSQALWAALGPVQVGGEPHVVTSALDFSKTIAKARPAYFPEEGTDVEQAPMAFHVKGEHASHVVLANGYFHVGLHAQLLAYDVTQSDGFNVDSNPEQTVPPRVVGGEYQSQTYRFYAGHLEREGNPVEEAQRKLDKIEATSIEFGGLNLSPADPIKQGQKGLAGAMSVLPLASTWSEDAAMRAAATVTVSGQADYRDFSLVWLKGLNLRWANGRSVQNMAAEGFGIPVDPEDNSGIALNHRSEPLWYRFAEAPDAPFGAQYTENGYPLSDAGVAAVCFGCNPLTRYAGVLPAAPFNFLYPSAGGLRGILRVQQGQDTGLRGVVLRATARKIRVERRSRADAERPAKVGHEHDNNKKTRNRP